MNRDLPPAMLAGVAPTLGATLLAHEPIGRAATVLRVSAPPHAPEWAERLADLGFVAGERVMVTARGRPGDDPLAVRVGTSTFALRRAEAACIHVVADPA